MTLTMQCAKELFTHAHIDIYTSGGLVVRLPGVGMARNWFVCRLESYRGYHISRGR